MLDVLGSSWTILDQTFGDVAPHLSDVDDALVLEDQQGNSHSIPIVLESDAKVLHWQGQLDQNISRLMIIAGWNMEDVRWRQVKTDEDRWNITHAPWVCLWIQSDEVLWESAPMFEHMANDLWPVAYDSQMRANAAHSGSNTRSSILGWLNHIKPPFLMAKRLNDIKCENIGWSGHIPAADCLCILCLRRPCKSCWSKQRKGGPTGVTSCTVGGQRRRRLRWVPERLGNSRMSADIPKDIQKIDDNLKGFQSENPSTPNVEDLLQSNAVQHRASGPAIALHLFSNMFQTLCDQASVQKPQISRYSRHSPALFASPCGGARNCYSAEAKGRGRRKNDLGVNIGAVLQCFEGQNLPREFANAEQLRVAGVVLELCCFFVTPNHFAVLQSEWIEVAAAWAGFEFSDAQGTCTEPLVDASCQWRLAN